MKPATVLLLALTLVVAPRSVVCQTDGRYGGDPLLVGAGARSLGMGSAFVAISDDATAIYWNPAGLASLEKNELQIQHAEQFGGSVDHDVFMLASPFPVGGFGIGLIRLGVDGIKLTSLEDPGNPAGPDNRPVVTGVESTTDYSLYLSYGRSVRPDLTVGASFKLIWRNLAVGDGSGYGIDLGLLYAPRPGLTGGLSIRNLTRTRVSFDSGSNDDIPPSAWLGIAYARPVPTLKGEIIVSTSLHFGEQKSPVDSRQGFRIGTEYIYQRILAFRMGVEGNHFTAGTGVKLMDQFGLDLALLENGQLDNTYRVSASFFF
jgi:hypothetical protein